MLAARPGTVPKLALMMEQMLGVVSLLYDRWTCWEWTGLLGKPLPTTFSLEKELCCAGTSSSSSHRAASQLIQQGHSRPGYPLPIQSVEGFFAINHWLCVFHVPGGWESPAAGEMSFLRTGLWSAFHAGLPLLTRSAEGRRWGVGSRAWGLLVMSVRKA